MKWFLYLFFLITFFASAKENLPPKAQNFLSRYCIDCHDEDLKKGKLNLDHLSMDWSEPYTRKKWAKIIPMLQNDKMPPAKKKKRPSEQEKKDFITWIDQTLLKHSSIGGTLAHRLNHREYLASVRYVFKRSDFELPSGFPIDGDKHHFDTEAASLLISPTHLEMYQATARKMANELLPPDPILPTKPHEWSFQAKDLTTSGTDVGVYEVRLRMIKSGPRMGTSIPKFQPTLAGIYKVKVKASAKTNSNHPTPILEVVSQKNKTPFTLKGEEAQTFSLEIEIQPGQPIQFFYPNTPLTSHYDKKHYVPYMDQFLKDHPKYINAYAKIKKFKRAILGWEQLQEEIQKKDFDPLKISPKSDAFQKLIDKTILKGRDFQEAMSYHFFENGPWLDIHHIEIQGPFKLTSTISTRRKATFLRPLPKQPTEADLQKFLSPYVERAYRRPITSKETQVYTDMVLSEINKGHGLESGLHLAIRMLLISPNFIFKAKEGPEFSSHELASRYSYFLQSKPPSTQLLQASQKDSFDYRQWVDTEIYSKEGVSAFIKDFCDQWLDLHLLEGINVDPRLAKRFGKREKLSLQKEIYAHFENILKKNLPITDFIDPDYLYVDKALSELYAVKGGPDYGKFKEVKINRGTRVGGLLTMPGIMMATANGVDTQPVLRGVWMLENILGTPPNEPPDNIPAVSPDITGAKTIKEIMAKHMEQPSCASCHQDIDPVGFIFENLNPIGQWRTHYPVAEKSQQLLPIDATGVMPDGTPLNDIRDLKAYMVENPHYFTRCLAEKIMTYATGRQMSYTEKKELWRLADQNIQKKEGFKDLFLELIDHDIFKTR